MSLKPLTWLGYVYCLSVRRHWHTCFRLAAMCEIKKPNLRKKLPAVAATHIVEMYDLAHDARAYFQSEDDWVRFQRRLCDEYCDYFVMQHWRPTNEFVDCNTHNAVQDFAIKSYGYQGPLSWW